MIQCQFFPILNSLKMNMNKCIWCTMEFLSFQNLVARKQWNQMIRFHLDWDFPRRILLSRSLKCSFGALKVCPKVPYWFCYKEEHFKLLNQIIWSDSESENDSLVSMRSKEEEDVGDMKYMNVNFFRSEFSGPKILQRMVKLAFPFVLMTPISIILATLPDMELYDEAVIFDGEERACVLVHDQNDHGDHHLEHVLSVCHT